MHLTLRYIIKEITRLKVEELKIIWTYSKGHDALHQLFAMYTKILTVTAVVRQVLHLKLPSSIYFGLPNTPQ